MDRKLIVVGVMIILIVIASIFIFGIVLKKPSNNPVVCPTCKESEDCDVATGQCIPRTSCGPKVLPPEAQCSVDQLVCDENIYRWVCCQGCCPAGYEGKECNCLISDQKSIATNVCAGQIPICQDDGTYKAGQAPTCQDVKNYLANVGVCTSVDSVAECLQATSCAEECLETTGIQCVDGPVSIECSTVCRSAPTATDCANPSCADTQRCMCDQTTGNIWKCKDVPVGPSGCPTDPDHSYCLDSGGTPQKTECMNCGVGYINYCKGHSDFPLACMANMTHATIGGRVIYFHNGVPVYPTIDNDNCVNPDPVGSISTDFLDPEYDRSYGMVGNPYAYLSNNRSNLEIVDIDDPTFAYYRSQHSEPINCWWNPEPVCSSPERGNFIQQCGSGDSMHDCIVGGDTTDRLGPPFPPNGRCNCNDYISQVDQVSTLYLGPLCQYDDATTCHNLGKATYLDGVVGCNCTDARKQYDPILGCACKPDYLTQPDGSCICPSIIDHCNESCPCPPNYECGPYGSCVWCGLNCPP